MKKIIYEQNIDILRGLSIILVVIYHLKLNFFETQFLPGGYIGVDIFFVISGYLITSILFTNLSKKNFNLKIFFLRRFIRIFPVYIFVIALTLLFGYFILIPDHLIGLAKSSNSSIFFYSNIFFWKYLNNYYNPDAILNPLLHTWSLAVEIQFYLLFPILFILLFKFKKHIKKILFLIGISSLILAIIFSYFEPQINFFGFQSRLWEFIIGSFIFFYKDKINLKLNNYSRYFIYLLIISFAFFFNANTYHPSFLTLFLLILVSLVILDKNKYKTNYFEKFLLFFGLISYSLYIWHYPILSLSERIFTMTDNIKIYVVLISIVLSYLSYQFLEKKLKKNFKNLLSFVTIFSILSFAMIFLYSINNGYESRLKFTNFYKNTLSEISRSKFKINDNEKNLNILIIGNSHSVQTYQGFIFNNENYKNLKFKNFHIQISCFNENIFSLDSDPCKGKLDFEEKEKFKQGKKFFKAADIIVLSTRWTEKDIINLPSVYKIIKNYNKKVVIFNSILDVNNKGSINMINDNNLNLVQKNYVANIFPYEKFLYLNNRYPDLDEIDKLQRIYYKNINQESYERSLKLKKIVNSLDLPLINLNEFLCDYYKKKCNFMTNENKPIFYDTTGHLTMNGAKYLFNKIKTKFYALIETELNEKF